MGELMLSMNKIRNSGIQNIAIVQDVIDGNYEFKVTKTECPNGAKRNTLVNFPCEGTGFIISTNQILVGQEMRLYALILTAGHVVWNFETCQPYKNNYHCYLENGKAGTAYLIKQFMELYPDELKSTITDAYYCFPGDCAILLMEVKGEINCYELASDIQVNSHCILSGYPVMPHDIDYCLPQLEDSSDKDIELEAFKLFCNFDGEVYSKGEIRSEANGLIEISCSSTSGMSGSPIISHDKVVGIHVGGPPIPGQRECIKILQKLKNRKNIADAIADLEILRNYDSYFTVGLFSDLLDSPNIIQIKLIIKAQSGIKLNEKELKFLSINNTFNITLKHLVMTLKNRLYEVIYSAVTCFKHKEIFQANVGISINHSAISLDIPKIIMKFSSINSCDTFENIIEQLKVEE